jgi:hypothetical protein
LPSADQASRISAEAYRLASTLPICTSQLTASRAADAAMSWR